MNARHTHRQVRLEDRKRRARRTLPRHTDPGRQGSTLMIVIVLLGLLSVLGVLFYTFAAAERSNSEYYAEGAKNDEEAGLPADVVMDYALQQVIVGTDPRLKNSVLWGSRYSMLANMLGVKNHTISDLTAFDGTGINVILDSATGEAVVDQNFDGVPDGGALLDEAGQPVFTGISGSDVQDLLDINNSPAANTLFERQVDKFPQPDVGYTYPDINNLFLAHVAWVRDRAAPFAVRPVIIPSFHRPQLLRTGAGGLGVPAPLWEDVNYDGTISPGEQLPGNGPDPAAAGTDPFKNRLLRPHPGHLYVPPSQQGTVQTPRYIFTRNAAAAAFGDGKHVFPFLPMYDGYNPTDNGTDVALTGKPAAWIGHQGLWSGVHATDPTFNDSYQFDVDNDSDGIREGIWLDLDFPVQELSDGTTYTVLHSVTVYDLNGLFNLNAHGNIQQLLFQYNNVPPRFAFDNLSAPFGWNTTPATPRMDFISASNLGMHTAEVNPAWGLTGRPGLEVPTANLATVFAQYQLFFGNLPQDWSGSSAALQQQRTAWQEVANMELAFLKMGRPEINSGSGSLDDLFPGVYGEEHLIAQNLGTPGARDPRLYPHPGTSVIDDNNDLNEGMESQPRSDTSSGTAVWLDVNQPFDALGVGSILEANGTDPKNVNLTNPSAPTNRVQWPTYDRYTGNGNVFWGLPGIAGGQLMTVPYAYGLFDDPSELALYANDQRDVDDPLAAEDAVFLAMSNTDITNLGITSRLQNLSKFNFATDPSTNARGEAIRKRFTTISNDRKNFAAPRAPAATGRNWEWTDDQGRTAQQLASAGVANQFKVRFPPTFGDPLLDPQNSPTRRYGPEDPFRGPVRFLLQATREDLQVAKQYQQRLSVNQLLIYNNQTKKLEYRDLTDHPLNPGAAVIPSDLNNYNSATGRPQTAQQYEFWARRDRQLLARDIYVLLYLLGPGLDGSSADNPTRTGWTTPYSPEQLEQMARFAVNLVDAQDKDNVITRFEYDRDLSDGWDLDDDPYTIGDGGGDRAEVWGVERQELAFSEALVFRTVMQPSNYSSTAHDDMMDRQFLYLELRNLAPYPVKFTDREAWQIVMRQVEPGDAAYNSALHPPRERRLTLRNNAGVVPAAGFYTIFSTDQNEPAQSPTVSPSAFQVDPAGGGATMWIAPLDSTTFLASASANGNHIDLVEDSVTAGGAFTLTDGQTTPTNMTNIHGAMLQGAAGPGTFALEDPVLPVRFVLRRRVHPTRNVPTTALEEADNPYVEVDRLVHPVMPTFDLGGMGSDPATIQAQLDNLVSQERPEPLSAVLELNNAPAGTPSHNTLDSAAGAENSVSTPTEFQFWQPHFDRAFTSLGDLLHLPIVGPPPYDNIPTDDDPNPWDGVAMSPARDSGYTRYAEMMWQSPEKQSANIPQNPTGSYFFTYAKNALGMFAVPDAIDRGTVGTADAEDNRWHRVLEFLEVPNRQHKNLGLGSELDIARVPGPVNLNTVRHTEVLAGLIDDETVADLNLVYDNTQAAPASINDSNYPRLVDGLNGGGEGIVRDWFEQFIASRDQTDPYWAAQGQTLSLPGLPINVAAPPTEDFGRPFRSLSFTQDGANSIQHTLLRSLPVDIFNGAASHRQLLEVGTSPEHLGNTIDPLLRHRILSKIWNNTTTRSNTFVVFVSAKLFRANVDATTGAVQIGGPLREFSATDPSPELPEYRGVFVVDRSDLEGAGQAGGGTISSFRPFVKYRRILQEP